MGRTTKGGISMKRILLLLCLLLGLWSFAGAEEIDPQAADVLLSACPGYEIIAADQCGNSLAAALAKGEQRVLCVAEKQGGTWTIVVQNPHALLSGMTPSILMDTDDALYWSYTDSEPVTSVQQRFSCFRKDGVWGAVSCTVAQAVGNGTVNEATLCWRDDGVMWQLYILCDENDNLLSQHRSAYVPAQWLAPYMTLATYDVNVISWPNLYYTGNWIEDFCLELAAAELLPEYTYLGGTVDSAGLELFLRDPQGRKVLAGVTSQGVTGDWRIVISAPLPEDAFYGYENFTSYLCVNGQLTSIRPFADGTWGVNSIWPLTAEDAAVYLGQNWVSESPAANANRAIGSHPWSDITAIDWATLPHTLQEAVSCLDTDGWAVVNNPNPADRLHLRTTADKASASLGKYYNGTPVEILHRGSTWTQVRILGIEGWMMTQYLAFDAAALSVSSAAPDLTTRDDISDPRLYAEPNASSANESLPHCESITIIGLIGDNWYHVWLPASNHGGYMTQSDFWPGNG